MDFRDIKQDVRNMIEDFGGDSDVLYDFFFDNNYLKKIITLIRKESPTNENPGGVPDDSMKRYRTWKKHK